QCHVADLKLAHQVVARRARLWTHQRLRPSESVEETALAGVRSADKRDAKRRPADRAALELPLDERELGQRLAQAQEHLLLGDEADVLFGEIEPGLDVREKVQQVFTQLLQWKRDAARQLRERLPQLVLIVGFDHAQDGLGARQVELAGEKCPKRELPP